MISLLSDCDMKALGEKELVSQLQARGELGTSPLRRCKLPAIEQFEQFQVIHIDYIYLYNSIYIYIHTYIYYYTYKYIYIIVYICSTLGSQQFTDSLAATAAPSLPCGTLR